nr:hypothetical protein [Tanacetum cinerariifolium]
MKESLITFIIGLRLNVIECSTKAGNVSKCSTKEANVLECSMIEANVPKYSTKKETKDVASHIEATNIVDPQTEEFLDKVEDDAEEEAEDDTDEEVEDDPNDETWSPKSIGTTSKKGATSSSSPSTKKTIVNRGEPVKGLALQEFAARNDLVQALHRIQALHDGVATALKQGD